MFRFENIIIAMQAVLYIEWDDKRVDKGLRFHFVSRAEPLEVTGAQAVRLYTELDAIYPDILVSERMAKESPAMRDVQIIRGNIPIRPIG